MESRRIGLGLSVDDSSSIVDLQLAAVELVCVGILSGLFKPEVQRMRAAESGAFELEVEVEVVSVGHIHIFHSFQQLSLELSDH